MKYTTEITHFSHPNHKLYPEFSDHPFKCDGCKEAGIGSRFSCRSCDYDLHHHCAAASAASSTLRHPFYPRCLFVFLPRPPGDSPRYCNACGRDAVGFVYHCRTCGFDLHPCCAALPHVLDVAGGARLFLYKKTGSTCHRCGRRGRSWSYRSACKSYNLHVACVTEMLVDSWQEIYYGKRGVAAVPASGGSYGGSYQDRGAGGSYGGSYVRIPSIRGVGKNHHRGKGKVKRCCEVAAMAVQVIISAVLGDPTAIIAGIIGSFISR
ncbi:protein VACUOLELESS GAMETOPHYTES-like [Typha angustifolia]|uniref:protein VACUOLELESS GAMETOPHYTES-like n=1 Tax=Typha angustifolia TaxID=59011 RepID=UPI003C2B1675